MRVSENIGTLLGRGGGLFEGILFLLGGYNVVPLFLGTLGPPEGLQNKA